MADIAKGIKLIVMDDKVDWCEMISQTARLLGHNPEAVTTLEAAYGNIQEAYNAGKPYDLIVIDLNFQIGDSEKEVPRGKEVLHFVKARHPYMACLVVSGVSMAPNKVLDLRDDNGLDYYIQKDHFDIDTFSNAIEKSLRRVKPKITASARKNELEKVIEKWKSVRIVLYGDLASAEKRAAFKGIDVDIATKNEIENYEMQLAKVDETISKLEKDL